MNINAGGGGVPLHPRAPGRGGRGARPGGRDAGGPLRHIRKRRRRQVEQSQGVVDTKRGAAVVRGPKAVLRTTKEVQKSFALTLFVTDGMGTPDPNPINLVDWSF